MIKSLTLEKRVVLGKSRVQIIYTSEEIQMGQKWSGSGTYGEIHAVDDYLVVTNINRFPVMVCTDISDLKEKIIKKTGCELIISDSFSNNG